MIKVEGYKTLNFQAEVNNGVFQLFFVDDSGQRTELTTVNAKQVENTFNDDHPPPPSKKVELIVEDRSEGWEFRSYSLKNGKVKEWQKMGKKSKSDVEGIPDQEPHGGQDKEKSERFSLAAFKEADPPAIIPFDPIVVIVVKPKR